MGRGAGRATALVAAGIALAVVGAPSTAAADVASDGLWYVDAYKVPDAHAAGFTGEGVTVAVIDQLINPDVPTLADADLRIQDPLCFVDGEPVATSDDEQLASHGTNVTSFIVGSGEGYDGAPGVVGVAPDATVLFYSIGAPAPGDEGSSVCETESGEVPTRTAISRAIDAAVDAGADIISMSIAGDDDLDIVNAVNHAINEKVALVFGVDNQQQDDTIFPGLGLSHLNGVVGVQAIDSQGVIPSHPLLEGGEALNTDPDTDVVAAGVGVLNQGGDGDWSTLELARGTSFATPIVAGFLAVVAQKHPDATGNQLVQSLIHNTGRGNPDLVFDASMQLGYGGASLTTMLTADPTQYPDENPLISADAEPTPEQIAAGPTAAPEAPTPAHGDGEAADIAPVVIGVVVGALVLIAVVVVVIVLVTRRGRRPAPPPPA